MKMKLIPTFAAIALVVLCGCHGDDTPQTDNKTMRDTFTGNRPFNINNVPPESRAMVLKMRGGGGGAPKQPAATAPTTAGTTAPSNP